MLSLALPSFSPVCSAHPLHCLLLIYHCPPSPPLPVYLHNVNSSLSWALPLSLKVKFKTLPTAIKLWPLFLFLWTWRKILKFLSISFENNAYKHDIGHKAYGRIKHTDLICRNPASWFLWQLLGHCFMAIMGIDDRERETSSGGLYFFSFFNPTSFPHRLFHSFPCLSRSPVPYISFTWALPLTLCCINFLSSYPIFPTSSLTLSLFLNISSPSLGRLFLSDIDWVCSSAAVKLWKWVVSLVILYCCQAFTSHLGMCVVQWGDAVHVCMS